jgi:putative PIN family toxin of toxin-antitoxin system
MIKVVFDTNILISALLFPGGTPDQVFKLCRRKIIQAYISDFILDEFERVLKIKFSLPSPESIKYVRLVCQHCQIIEPKARVDAVKIHDADNRILECAVSSNADYLVTGNKKHLLPLGEYQNIKIVSAAAFLEAMRSRGEALLS